MNQMKVLEKIEALEIINTIGGVLLSGSERAYFRGVSIDSRTIEHGEVFFAIEGKNFDGHDFVNNAIEKGAKGVVISKPVGTVRDDVSVILVDDTLKALQKLARFFRRGIDCPVVAITGTAGKTTTKEITAEVLSVKFRVHKNVGNINNEYGVPLTLLSTPPYSTMLVMEVGINQVGEMKVISDIVMPTTAIVTNIGPGHIGYFGSVERIAREKEQLFLRLPRDGYAILNADDPYTCQFSTFARKITYGIDKDADIMPDDLEEVGVEGMRFRIEGVDFYLHLPGRHNLYNALGAIACGCAYNIKISDMVEAVSSVKAVDSRMEIEQVGGIILVNDAYNANPLSMRSSISWFVRQPYERHILVLGDMLELGEFGEEEHIRMGEYIAELHNAGMVDLLFTTGELGRFISESAGRVSSKDDWIVNVDKGCLKDDLLKVLKKGDSILFKASRVIALDEVFREILSDFNREER